MRKSIKLGITTILLITLFFSTIALAVNPELYLKFRNYLVSVKDEYMNKESGLAQSGQSAQDQLRQSVQGIEGDMRDQLNIYEQQQKALAEQELQKQVNEIINQMNQDKQSLVDEAKVKIREKMLKDLEKEIVNLEKALEKK